MLLRDKLIKLKEKFGVDRLKGGTEVEDLTFEEIAFMKKFSQGIMPMTVKIGGPEARNDMRMMVKLGVEGVLGPMIESPYALKNYIDTLTNLQLIDKFDMIAINIETLIGSKNLLEMTKLPQFERLNQITVGRGDLSMSMGMTVDDPEVIEVTKMIVDIAHKEGLSTSVGGGITPRNGRLIISEIGPKKINTRHISIDCSLVKDIGKTVEAVLDFELTLYEELAKVEPDKAKFYHDRIAAVIKRMGKKD